MKQRLHNDSHILTRRCKQGLGWRLDHEVCNVIVSGNGPSSNKTFTNDMVDSGNECFHVLSPGVMLGVVRGLLGGCRVDQEGGWGIFIFFTPR